MPIITEGGILKCKRIVSGQGFSAIGTVSHPTNSYIDYSVQTGHLDFAYYKVTSVDAAPLESGFSNEVSIQVNATSKPSVQFWQQLVQLPGGGVYALIIDSWNYIFAGTDGSGAFVSTDNGNSWNPSNGGLGGSRVLSFALGRPDTLFAGTNFGLYRSTNHGTTWMPTGSFENPYCIALNSRGYIFVGAHVIADGILYRSTDSGSSWMEIRLPLRAIPLTLSRNLFDHMFAGTTNGIFRTTNDGAAWDSISVGLTTRTVWDIEIDNNGILYAGTYLGGVFRSTNNGDTWSFAGLPGEDVLSLAVNSQGHVFAGTTNHGVFVSLDNGLSWSAQNSGLADSVVSALAINQAGFAFAGSFPARVYRSVQSTMSVTTPPSLLPMALQLAQNYPNPFNPSTQVKYVLPEGSFVSLKVFDVLGRDVAMLVQEYQQAGTHQVRFDASGLSSGTYIYRIAAGRYSATKKMMVIR